MSDIPSLTPGQIEKIIKKKGYELNRTKGSHKIYYHSGLKHRVVIPFHKKDLPKGTMLEILKQAGIKTDELNDLL